VLRYTRVVEDAEDIVQQSFSSFRAFVQFQENPRLHVVDAHRLNEALMFLRRMVRRARYRSTIFVMQKKCVQSRIPDSMPIRKPAVRGERKCGFCRRRFGICPRLRTTIALSELRELSTSETARRMGSQSRPSKRASSGEAGTPPGTSSYLKPTRKSGADVARRIPQPLQRFGL